MKKLAFEFPVPTELINNLPVLNIVKIYKNFKRTWTNRYLFIKSAIIAEWLKSIRKCSLDGCILRSSHSNNCACFSFLLYSKLDRKVSVQKQLDLLSCIRYEVLQYVYFWRSREQYFLQGMGDIEIVKFEGKWRKADSRNACWTKSCLLETISIRKWCVLIILQDEQVSAALFRRAYGLENFPHFRSLFASPL